MSENVAENVHYEQTHDVVHAISRANPAQPDADCQKLLMNIFMKLVLVCGTNSLTPIS